jgi:hypothetical protein
VAEDLMTLGDTLAMVGQGATVAGATIGATIVPMMKIGASAGTAVGSAAYGVGAAPGAAIGTAAGAATSVLTGIAAGVLTTGAGLVTRKDQLTADVMDIAKMAMDNPEMLKSQEELVKALANSNDNTLKQIASQDSVTNALINNSKEIYALTA